MDPFVLMQEFYVQSIPNLTRVLMPTQHWAGRRDSSLLYESNPSSSMTWSEGRVATMSEVLRPIYHMEC